jgi:hypothetical protein
MSGRKYNTAATATADRPNTVKVCCAVVATPRAVFVTEVHVTGWLAMVWANFAAAPLKRLIIEFPFVAAKTIPRRENAHIELRMPCIRNIVYRRSAVDLRRHC